MNEKPLILEVRFKALNQSSYRPSKLSNADYDEMNAYKIYDSPYLNFEKAVYYLLVFNNITISHKDYNHRTYHDHKLYLSMKRS